MVEEFAEFARGCEEVIILRQIDGLDKVSVRTQYSDKNREYQCTGEEVLEEVLVLQKYYQSIDVR